MVKVLAIIFIINTFGNLIPENLKEITGREIFTSGSAKIKQKIYGDGCVLGTLRKITSGKAVDETFGPLDLRKIESFELRSELKGFEIVFQPSGRELSFSTEKKRQKFLDVIERVKNSCNKIINCGPLPDLNFGMPQSLLSGTNPVRNTRGTIQFLNGQESLYERYQSIQKTKNELFIESFQWTADATGKFLANELIKKKKDGVRIELYLDNLNTFINILSLKQRRETYQMYDNLMAAGIPVYGHYCGQGWNQIKSERAYANRKDRDKNAGRRDGVHKKTWTRDGKEVITGGINIVDFYTQVLEKRENWRDLDVRVQNKEIGNDFRENFIQGTTYMSRERGAPQDLSCFNPHPVGTLMYEKFFNNHYKEISPSKNTVVEKIIEGIVDGKAYKRKMNLFSVARAFSNRPLFKETHIEDYYTQMVNMAQNRIMIVNPYYMPSDALDAAIKRAAERGVLVKIVVNGTHTLDIPFPLPGWRTQYNSLLNAGFEKNSLSIYEFTGELGGQVRHGLLHAKFIIVDDLIFVGSHNLDYFSRLSNTESGISIKAQEVSARLGEIFDREFVRYSKKIDYPKSMKFLRPSNPIKRKYNKFIRNHQQWF